jgi:hypothetical protein
MDLFAAFLAIVALRPVLARHVAASAVAAPAPAADPGLPPLSPAVRTA